MKVTFSNGKPQNAKMFFLIVAGCKIYELKIRYYSRTHEQIGGTFLYLQNIRLSLCNIKSRLFLNQDIIEATHKRISFDRKNLEPCPLPFLLGSKSIMLRNVVRTLSVGEQRNEKLPLLQGVRVEVKQNTHRNLDKTDASNLCSSL